MKSLLPKNASLWQLTNYRCPCILMNNLDKIISGMFHLHMWPITTRNLTAFGWIRLMVSLTIKYFRLFISKSSGNLLICVMTLFCLHNVLSFSVSEQYYIMIDFLLKGGTFCLTLVDGLYASSAKSWMGSI